MMSREHAGHRAFVMVTALLIMALVAVAVVALASATTYDGRSTIREWQAAQLDQMLLAGAADASLRLSSGAMNDAPSWIVELPSGLASDEATLSGSTKSKEPDRLTLRIDATLGDRRAQQILTYKRNGNSWKLENAQLDG